MEILKFDEIKNVSEEKSITKAPAGVTSDISNLKLLKPTLIADVFCSSITGGDTGCCKGSGGSDE